MALHRDIYWVGRQWAVTGFGVQACDQKQKSKFDIEAARLWEDGVLDGVRTLKWLNIEDFDRALDVARKYYPEPARKTAPPASVSPPPLKANGQIEPRKLVVQAFHMRIHNSPAKFQSMWRIRMRFGGG
jgi:hypothetical protein